MNKKLVLSALLFPLFLSTISLYGDDWPRWRGPRQTGEVSANISLETGKPEILWKHEIGSGGYSAISVKGRRAYTLISDGAFDYAVCLEAATGKEVWRLQLDKAFPGRNGAHTGPLSTPTVHENTVFVLDPRGDFLAVDTKSGKINWRKNLRRDFGGVQPYFGFSTAPLIFDDRVIVQSGGNSKNTLICLEQKTGTLLWGVYLGPVDYSSPVLATFFGQQQIICVTNQKLAAVSPQTGDILWQRPLNTGQSAYATPLVLPGNRVFISGLDKGVMLRIGQQAGKLHTEIIWQNNTLKGNFSEPVYADGNLYGYDNAFLVSVDARRGKRNWKSRQPGDGALILVNNILVIKNTNGELILVRPGPTAYEELQRIPVLSGVNLTPPSFAGGKLFLRSLSEMACLNFQR